jgi:hypothetical protein
MIPSPGRYRAPEPLVGDPHRRVHLEDPGVLVEEEHRAAHDAEPLLEQLQGPLQHRADLAAAGQGPSDLASTPSAR